MASPSEAWHSFAAKKMNLLRKVIIFSFRGIGNFRKVSLDSRDHAIFQRVYLCINNEKAYCDKFFQIFIIS